MKALWFLLCLEAAIGLPSPATSAHQVMCYYDSRSFYREGPGKMLPVDVEPSLSYCTHLIYGYAKIDASDYEMEPMKEHLEQDSTMDNYRAITSLKKRYPALRILLSVGGGADTEDPNKYNELLEESDRREEFVSSAKSLVKQNGFDGLDVAWQFPAVDKKKDKDRGKLGNFWHGVKETFGMAHSHEDEKAEEHRDGFTKLIGELNKKFKSDNLLLTTTVLPNVNASLYYDVKEINKHVDFINLMTFDFKNPKRDPTQADYPAALYPDGGISHLYTADGQVRWWLEHGVPGNKIILGIPTFARTWRLTSESKISAAPPIEADGPGEEGPYSKTAGLMSYAEVCTALNPAIKGTAHSLRRVADPTNKLGSYAFRLPPAGSTEGGIWVGYEEPETASNKASYVKNKSLGGVAMFDVSLDDFRGVCTGDKFPIIRAVTARLQ